MLKSINLLISNQMNPNIYKYETMLEKIITEI